MCTTQQYEYNRNGAVLCRRHANTQVSSYTAAGLLLVCMQSMRVLWSTRQTSIGCPAEIPAFNQVLQ